MAWRQDKPFNTSKAGTAAGWCLRNVRLGYGVAGGVDYAIQAWNATKQHKDRNFPAGVAVPLFYTYKTAGHVNVRLADGRVWSDGRVYPNLAAYERASTSKYLGWGETLNGVRLVSYINAPTPAPTPAPSSGGTLHLNKGTDTTVFDASGNKLGVIHAIDDSYNYQIRGWLGNKVAVKSASIAPDGRLVYIAIRYISGGVIPGRYIK